jgi:hypothetical protein
MTAPLCLTLCLRRNAHLNVNARRLRIGTKAASWPNGKRSESLSETPFGVKPKTPSGVCLKVYTFGRH